MSKPKDDRRAGLPNPKNNPRHTAHAPAQAAQQQQASQPPKGRPGNRGEVSDGSRRGG